MSKLGALRDLVLRRRMAYRAVFKPGGELSPAAQSVLSDLREFCRATKPTIVVSPVTRQVDPLASAVAEGRREVWNRICNHLHVTDEDLYRLVENNLGEDHE